MLSAFLAALVLVLVQVVAFLPWGIALTWELYRKASPAARRSILGGVALFGGGGVVVASLVLAGVFYFLRDPVSLKIYGGVYAAVLQAQVIADLFVFALLFIQWVWPKGGAVARAAFREGHRQPMFWLFVSGGIGLMTLSPFVPYFTFGEDHIMVKELGFDTIMLAAVAFGTIAASMSINEEIEGRTAVTLMSKPISRRQFLLGKFLGIYLTCLLLVAILSWYFDAVMLHKRWFDDLPFVALPEGMTRWLSSNITSTEARDFLSGSAIWGLHAFEILIDLVKSASQVMVLVAIAVALATRLPMVVNLVTCLVVFFLSNLMPVLVQQTRPTPGQPVGPVQQLLAFIANLFDALLPALELFAVQPTVIGEAALPTGEYLKLIGSVFLYGLMLTAIFLILGLALFEDKDLA